MRLCTNDSDKQCLPDIIECSDYSQWNEYLNNLYQDVFVQHFIKSYPIFKGLKVFIRKEPKDGEWEHGFTHMTHVDLFHTSSDPNERIPDPRRSERLPWVRKIIENYECSVKTNCNEILYWEEMYRGRVRSCLLFKDEQFLVVLEKAKNVYFIITSFFIERDWEMKKRLKKYERYQKQKTPLA